MRFTMLRVGDGRPELVIESENGPRIRAKSLFEKAVRENVVPAGTQATLDDLLGLEDPRGFVVWLADHLEEGDVLAEDAATVLQVPVTRGDVFCIGRNYVAHAAELGNEVPGEPIVFMKPRTCLIAGGEAVVLPKGYERVDYEGEIALVIGRSLLGEVTPEEARAAIFGVTLLNDVSDRAMQTKLKEKGKPWLVAKGRATFGPCGPSVLLHDEAHPVESLTVETRVNGDLRQSGDPSLWIWNAVELIRHLAATIGLHPGDLIATGTPKGVGPLAPSDVVEVSSPAIGVLSNPVIEAK